MAALLLDDSVEVHLSVGQQEVESALLLVPRAGREGGDQADMSPHSSTLILTREVSPRAILRVLGLIPVYLVSFPGCYCLLSLLFAWEV